jgi:hypothetical protein
MLVSFFILYYELGYGIYFYIIAKLLLILPGRYTSNILMSSVCEIRLLCLVLPTVFLCHWDVMASQNTLCSGN